MRWLRSHFYHLSPWLVMATVVATWVYGAWGLLLLAPTVVVVALTIDAIARASSSIFYPTISHGARSGNRVALTFDDGPDPNVTPQVLDALAHAGATATFFVIGRKLSAHPDIARRIVAEGHTLANHSWRHSRLQNFYTARAHGVEIDRCNAAIAAHADTEILFRPPVGLKSGALAKAAWPRKLRLIAWSLHSHDTRLDSATAIAQRVLERIRPGDIVLMHDGHDRDTLTRPACVPALQLILDGLADKNLCCVSVPQLLK